jgi:hypothetical protein
MVLKVIEILLEEMLMVSQEVKTLLWEEIMLLLEIKTMLEEIKTKLTVIPMLSKAI